MLISDARSVDFLENGCKGEIDIISYFLRNPDLIEENFNMIPSDKRKQVENQSEYRMATEYAAAMTMKRWLDLEREFAVAMAEVNCEGQPGLVVRARRLGKRVKIMWELKRIPAVVMGFRSTSPFTANPYDETGDRIIRDPSSNNITEELVPGNTYYYTLYTADYSGKVPSYADWCQFKIQVPDEAEMKSIEARHERLMAQLTSAKSTAKETREEEAIRMALEAVEGIVVEPTAFAAARKEVERRFPGDPHTVNAVMTQFERVWRRRPYSI